MTHDDVIRLARQVADPDTTDPLCGGDQRDLITLNLDEMVRFAALVEHATIERIKHPLRTEHNRYSDIVSDGGIDPRGQT